jgi:hypothetical protein
VTIRSHFLLLVADAFVPLMLFAVSITSLFGFDWFLVKPADIGALADILGHG